LQKQSLPTRRLVHGVCFVDMGFSFRENRNTPSTGDMGLIFRATETGVFGRCPWGLVCRLDRCSSTAVMHGVLFSIFSEFIRRGRPHGG
jgi:hypothetical protein